MKNLALLDEMQLNLAKERVLVLDDVVDNNSMFYLEYQLNKLKKIDKDLGVKKTRTNRNINKFSRWKCVRLFRFDKSNILYERGRLYYKNTY